jgi:hypothetical protein
MDVPNYCSQCADTIKNKDLEITVLDKEASFACRQNLKLKVDLETMNKDMIRLKEVNKRLEIAIEEICRLKGAEIDNHQ